MLFLIGTYADETLLKIVKYKRDMDGLKPLQGLSDDRILQMVSTSTYPSELAIYMPNALTHFFAADMEEARRIARQMGLKNFSVVEAKIYKAGTHF